MSAEDKHFSGSEIVEIGVEIEKNGHDFYNIMSDKLKDPKVKDFFRFMAGEEEKHIHDFQSILGTVKTYEPYESYPQEYFAYLNTIASEYIFTKKDELQDKIKSIETEKEAIDVSLGLEKESILFYEEMKKALQEKEKAIIDKIIEQEKNHAKGLLELRSSLKKERKDG
ncbi:MAG: ferritin family protein [Candidatus Omnitrophica bacterium]|nr:ferritin family protein [Candidatus Omnitrophota bacterium]